MNDEQLVDEALARAIGDKGEKIIKKKGGLLNFAKFRAWMAELWRKLADAFGIRYSENLERMTLDNFTNIAVSQLLSGKNLQTETQLEQVNETFNKQLQEQIQEALQDSMPRLCEAMNAILKAEGKEEYMAMREAEHANKSVLLSTKLTQEVLPKEVAAEHNTWTAYTEFTHPLHPEYHCYICAYHEERNSVSAMTVKNQKTFFGEIPLSKFDVNISGYSFERNVDFQTTSVKELIDMHQQHNVQTVKVEQTSTPKTTELNAVTYIGHTTDSSTKEFKQNGSKRMKL